MPKLLVGFNQHKNGANLPDQMAQLDDINICIYIYMRSPNSKGRFFFKVLVAYLLIFKGK